MTSTVGIDEIGVALGSRAMAAGKKVRAVPHEAACGRPVRA